MNRLLPWLVVTVLLVGVAWAFPPFRLRSIKAMRDVPKGHGTVDSKDFVSKFWENELLPAAGRAPDVADVLKVIVAEPKEVRERFGRTVGLSTSYFLFVRGSGRIVSTSDDAIGLSLKPEGGETDVVVPLDFVFGNAVRDGTGLLDPGRYPNTQEFNDLGARLNQLVERNVLPEFRRFATVGKRVEFAGCVEVVDEETDLKPLKLVPVVVKGE